MLRFCLIMIMKGEIGMYKKVKLAVSDKFIEKANKKMVESKSLKLYLFSFRNHGDFHEDCVNIIMKDLIRVMDPKYIEVWGKFTPRGGISIDPYTNYGKPGTKWEEVTFERLTHHDLYPEKIDNR